MTDSLLRALPRRALLGTLAAALALAAAVTGVPSIPAQAAGDPCGTGGNKIACENSKPGTPQSVWDVDGSGDASIQGFSTDISVNVGQRIDFKVDTTASAYTVTIYRTGYYGGNGARQIATVSPSAVLPQTQPQCITDVSTELYDCGNWGVSASWSVPSTAVSGVYIARLHRADRDDSSLITFIVRDDASRSDVVFQTSDPTWQAYNTYGGADFYRGGDNGRAYKISYNRPVLTRDGPGGRDMYFSNEYPLVRFLERNGYDVSYIAGVDTDRAGALLKNHKTFLSVGHDEYWSKAQRANVESARDAGVNLQFLSGNEVYWKTRYEASADASRTPYRTLTSYKETWSNAKIDPSAEWTGTWRDPRFAPRSAGAGVPENALTGTMYMVNSDDLALKVPADQGKNRLWRNTSVATLASGSATLAPHTVGYESDEDIDNGSRPPGLIRLSTTTGAVSEYLTDFGNTVKPGATTHHLTMYRAASGALVFGAGTVQWTWGLDAVHDSPYAAVPADKRMQQAQVNLLADMGAQPTTLDTTLVAATKSTDTTGPTVAVTAPAEGSARPNGTSVTLTGTAGDVVGRVAAIEVSTDSGATWHPATGTTSWSYTYVQSGSGPTPVRVRAVDDSANIGPAVTRSFTVSCPCSVFGATVPKVPASTDASAAELGLRFSPTADGFVSGVRFYKGTGNSGSHVGTLWSSSGQKLATVTFANETATGWQTATFSAAVSVSAGQTYVVSYTAPSGRYAVQAYAFSSAGVQAPPLSVAGGFEAAAAGVYGNAGQLPSLSYQDANYFVDVLFTSTDNSPLVVTNQWPVPDSSSVPASTTVSAKLSRAVTATPTVTVKDPNGATVAGSTTYDAASRVVTFTPSSPLAGFVRHTVTLSATDTQGNPISTGGTWAFTTARPPGVAGVCPCTLFEDTLKPTMLEDVDSVPVTLGVRFTSDVAGAVTGVRFYKGPNNTGTHTGTLWSATGTKLAQGVFTGESSNGWQTLTFAQPVTIAKNTTYVASYRTLVGKYSATVNAFASSDLSRAPLRVTSSSGTYSYADVFPTATSSTSYLVDLVFEKAAAQLSVVSQSPAPGALDVPRGSPIAITFSEPIRPGSTVAVTQQPAGTALAGTTALDASATKLTFTPSAVMPANSDVRVQVSGVVSVEGVALATQSWTFRTRAVDGAGGQSLFGDVLPQSPSANESSPVELGTAFVPVKAGSVTALRFFKAADNLGTHTGSLWSSTGTRLATVTFTGESASGWQSATLSSPVAVSAGQTYVVSYLAPQGHYSSTSGFFSGPWTSGDLTAPSGNNGRYLYGAAGGFPTGSYGSTNYFVDVLFTPAAASIAVTDRTPAPGATGVSREVDPVITLSAPVADGYSMTLTQGSTAVSGSVTRSADRRAVMFTPASPLAATANLTVTVSGVTSTEGAVLPTQTWSFTTEAATTAGTSLFTGQVPATPDANDSGQVELGTVFTPSADGAVTQITFYKGAGATGVHQGSIWSSTGTRLGTVSFTNETASGWQTATLPTPVAVTAGQSYVVSYYAPNGHYAVTTGFFSAPWTAGPLTAPAGQNGRYLYASGGGFPTGSYNASNYFVDVVFRASNP